MITRIKSAEAMQSVIANGHIWRRMSQIGTRNSVIGLRIPLATAAAASGAKNASALAIGVASSAQRFLMDHTRIEESSTDQSAIRYLAAAGISTRGAIEVQDTFKGQDVLSEARQDSYAHSHPFTRDRVRAMEAYVAAYGGEEPYDASGNYWCQRAKAKISD